MVLVESLDHDGYGVARIDGKVTFIDGALPGEAVNIRTWRRKRRFDFAAVTAIHRQSSMRVVPLCPHYERCGGCSLQHLDAAAQVAAKQRVLEDNLLHLGGVRPEVVMRAIHGPVWGYRHRARLSVRMVAGKKGALVGFHERRTHYVVDMDSCQVLPPQVSTLILPLRALISSLEVAPRIPQIEVAVADNAVLLALRVLDAPSDHDLDALRDFSARHQVDLYLQPGGPDTLRPLGPERAHPLCYRLPEFGLELRFQPGDFTQVNHAVNRVLVRRSVALLAPRPGDRIADLFCGLGNFTLPLARSGAKVVGVEGSKELVLRARENAMRNGLGERVRCFDANLYDDAPGVLARIGPQDKMLIDPPRDGARALVQALGPDAPARLVYVSCNPATLARDAGILVMQKDYRFRAAGVVNMFPHTSHVESVALFER